MRAARWITIGLVVSSLVGGALPAMAGDKDRNNRRRTATPAPSNDSFTTGSEITELPFTSSTDFTSATLEAFEPQPSCSTATATTWFRLAVAEDQNLVAETAAGFPTAIAVYSGDSITSLSEVACAAQGEQSSIAIPATGGQVYLFQVAAAKKHRGLVDFSLHLDTWRHEELRKDEHAVTVPAIENDAVVIDGQPRANNNEIYDVTLEVAGTTIGPFGVETDPVVLPGIHQELVKVPGQEVKISLTTAYRYDSAQRKCVLYQGEDCMAGVPVSGSTSWYASEGAKAEFVVTLRIELNGRLVSERTVNVPFAGQVGGLLP